MKIILCAILTSFSLSAQAAEQPIYQFTCEGYNKDSGQFWIMEGQAKNVDSAQAPIANKNGSYTYNVAISGPGKNVRREAFGVVTDHSFYFLFFPNDIPNSSVQFEGIMTVENTAAFPVVTRFVAHGWLGQNPLISTYAFDFTCLLY